MSYDHIKRNFPEGFTDVQQPCEQEKYRYNHEKNDDKLLWDEMECNNEQQFEELLEDLVKEHEADGMYIILAQILSLIRIEKYDMAFVGLHYILKVADNCVEERDPFIKGILGDILTQLFSVAIDNMDDLDQMYLATIGFMCDGEESGFRTYIQEIIIRDYERITEKVLHMNSHDLILEYCYCLLKYDLDQQLTSLMIHIIEIEWPFLEANIGEKQFAKFLWYAYYLKLDDKFVDISSCGNIDGITSQHRDIMLYKKYYELKNSVSPSKDRVMELKQLFEQSQLFRRKEKIRVWGSIKCYMDPLLQSLDRSKKTIPNRKITTKIVQIKKKVEWCPYCVEIKLTKQEFIVQGRNRITYELGRQIVFPLLTCEKCKRTFVNHEMKEQLCKALEPDEIKIYSYSRMVIEPASPTLPRTVKYAPIAEPDDSNSTYFAWPSTEASESNGEAAQESNFRQETDLYRLGYRITGLNRYGRWDVLVRRAIPSMTLKEIVYTIARNVRLRKSQSGGRVKYAHAIAEWEHDLKRLKDEYYHYNFDWPRY